MWCSGLKPGKTVSDSHDFDLMGLDLGVRQLRCEHLAAARPESSFVLEAAPGCRAPRILCFYCSGFKLSQNLFYLPGVVLNPKNG